MMNRRILAGSFACSFLFLCSLAIAGQDDMAALVGRLPTNRSARDDVELEKRIAEHGTHALPALVNELHLGIRFKALNRLLQSEGSRRLAVVKVLARIPGEESTDLLVRSLSDPPDCYGMTVVTLEALTKRALSKNQIAALIGNQEPKIALAGIAHAKGKTGVPAIKAAVERVFHKETAKAQFRNEYGASLAGPDALWEVRLTAGKALNKDMLPEIRTRAGEILAVLQREALHPTEPNKPVRMSYASQAEGTICGCLNQLCALGQPVKDLVESAAKEAEGNHAKVLDMALARLGDRRRAAKVADHLTSSDSPNVRFCAAMTLRMLRDKFSIPALRKALRDPYQRQDGSCVRVEDGNIYPIRIVAADALVELGEDPKEVRGEMRK